ncbi:MAG: hypothetical protein HS122_14065 [Opitutaceae bacterium]|nr:hypothetical protein [Opitutaceae bacterium]
MVKRLGGCRFVGGTGVRNGTCKVTTVTGARTEVAVEASGKTLRTVAGPVTTTFHR